MSPHRRCSRMHTMNLCSFFILIVEQTLRTSETITHWALARNLQANLSHEYDTWHLVCYIMSSLPPTGPPVTHICRRVRSHSLMQRKRCGWQRNSGNIFEFSVQKYITNIFPHGPKSFLTSVINIRFETQHSTKVSQPRNRESRFPKNWTRRQYSDYGSRPRQTEQRDKMERDVTENTLLTLQIVISLRTSVSN